MSTDVFLKIRSRTNAHQLIAELLRDGIEPGHIRIHAADPPDVPIDRITYRTTAQTIRQGIIAGGLPALAGAVLLLSLGGIGSVGAAFIPILGAAAGSLWWWQRNRARNRSVLPQRSALERGEMLLVLAVDDEHVGQIESRVAARHPEVSILGSDAAGTPPFP